MSSSWERSANSLLVAAANEYAPDRPVPFWGCFASSEGRGSRGFGASKDGDGAGAVGCRGLGGVPRSARGGGGVEVRGGAKSVSSFEHSGHVGVPSGLHKSHIPQTTPISCSSFCNVSSRSLSVYGSRRQA